MCQKLEKIVSKKITKEKNFKTNDEKVAIKKAVVNNMG